MNFINEVVIDYLSGHSGQTRMNTDEQGLSQWTDTDRQGLSQ